MTRLLAATAATLAASLALIALGRHLGRPSRPSWIDQRIASERDPGRRAAWRLIRDNHGASA